MAPDALDLGLQIGDALVELRHRHRIEILPGEQRDRIVGAARESLVGIHGGKR
jgi:predicted Zn-dependent protease